MAGAHVTEEEQFVPALGVRPPSSYMGKVGPKTIHLNQFSWLPHTKTWTMDGWMAMTYSLESNGKEACETIMEILGTLAGKLPTADFLSMLCMAL